MYPDETPNISLADLLGGGGPETLTPSMLPGAAPPPNLRAMAVMPEEAPQSRFQKVLQFALPLLATAYALKSGGDLGEFTNSYMRAGEYKQNEAAQRERLRLQQDSQNRLFAAEARRQAHEERTAAEAAAQRAREIQAGRDKAIHDALQRAIDQAAKNPDFMQSVNEAGPENFAIAVPGLGNISLREAFDRIGVVSGPKGYSYGEGPKPAPKEELVPVPGPGGPVYGPKVKGGPVYQRPRAPKEPTKPTRRSYNWKDDDPDSETYNQTFRITEDENGTEINKKRITGAATPMPSHAPTPSKYSVGQTVKLKDGRTVTIKKINPDGTFEF